MVKRSRKAIRSEVTPRQQEIFSRPSQKLFPEASLSPDSFGGVATFQHVPGVGRSYPHTCWVEAGPWQEKDTAPVLGSFCGYTWGGGEGKEDAGGVGGWFLSRQFYISQSSAEEKHL